MAVYKRLAQENIDLIRFRDYDRTSLVINGLKDHDLKVIEACQAYLIQQFCLQPEYRNKADTIVLDEIEPSWLQSLDFVLPKLNLKESWDDVRLSEGLKLLFSEILIPTYSKLDN